MASLYLQIISPCGPIQPFLRCRCLGQRRSSEYPLSLKHFSSFPVSCCRQQCGPVSVPLVSSTVIFHRRGQPDALLFLMLNRVTLKKHFWSISIAIHTVEYVAMPTQINQHTEKEPWKLNNSSKRSPSWEANSLTVSQPGGSLPNSQERAAWQINPVHTANPT